MIILKNRNKLKLKTLPKTRLKPDRTNQLQEQLRQNVLFFVLLNAWVWKWPSLYGSPLMPVKYNEKWKIYFCWNLKISAWYHTILTFYLKISTLYLAVLPLFTRNFDLINTKFDLNQYFDCLFSKSQLNGSQFWLYMSVFQLNELKI